MNAPPKRRSDNRKPVLGYPSVTDAIRALRAEGVPTEAIATRVGRRVSTVAQLESIAARSGASEPVRISCSILAELSAHAERRGLTVNELVRLLVHTIAAENMIDAVLDDMPVVAPVVVAPTLAEAEAP